MKHLYRKPLLPVLLMAILLFGTCFMTLFQKGMAEDRQRIEDIYNHTHIYIEAFTAGDANQALKMNIYRGDRAAELDEIADSMKMLECYYSLHSPSQTEIFSTVHGTNNPDAFAKYHSTDIIWGDSWDREAFLNTEKQTACIMSDTMAETLELSIGESFVITPTVELGIESENAPERILTLAGTYSGKQSSMSKNALIVPDNIYLGENGLLYNSLMMYNCFYHAYRLELDPVYNRDIDMVLEKIESKLIDSYTLVTNARTMRQAIRPIELKLQLQEMLELPLMALFCIATVLMGLLLSLSLKTETFLRFLVGEHRLCVFLKMMGSLLLILLLFSLLALGLVWLVAGEAWLLSALNYLKITTILTVLAMAIPLTVSCSKNLVTLYQQRES